jgi:hypothetical protein
MHQHHLWKNFALKINAEILSDFKSWYQKLMPNKG